MTLFSYRPYIKPSVDNYPQLCLEQLSTFGLDIWADMKTKVFKINIHIEICSYSMKIHV